MKQIGDGVRPPGPILIDAELLKPLRRAYCMVMPLAVPRYTVADLDQFPEDGNRYELLEGMLLVTPAPGSLHQVVSSRLFGELIAYLKPAGLGFAVSPGVIHTGPTTQLEPDVLVIPARYTAGTPWRRMTERWLAVEVSGRDSRVYDRDYKADAYLRLGVREAWRVDLRDRLIYVSRPRETPDVPHAEHLIWHPPEMAAPLTLDIPAIFQGYEPSAWS